VIPTRYVTIVCDPPWSFTDTLSMSDVKRSAGSQYQTMTIPEIKALGQRGPLRIAGHHLAPDAFLWLWITNTHLIDGSGAAVAKAWGFNPRQLVTWVKGRIVEERFVPQIGLGHMTRGATEHLLLCTRGRSKFMLKNRRTPNVFIAPRGRHSEKPQAAYDLIEQLTPGPYLDLFARKRREGWQGWGLEYPEAIAS
jgi:N6-adenosine-specific RNA methylase IME4